MMFFICLSLDLKGGHIGLPSPPQVRIAQWRCGFVHGREYAGEESYSRLPSHAPVSSTDVIKRISSQNDFFFVKAQYRPMITTDELIIGHVPYIYFVS